MWDVALGWLTPGVNPINIPTFGSWDRDRQCFIFFCICSIISPLSVSFPLSFRYIKCVQFKEALKCVSAVFFQPCFFSYTFRLVCYGTNERNLGWYFFYVLSLPNDMSLAKRRSYIYYLCLKKKLPGFLFPTMSMLRAMLFLYLSTPECSFQ